MRQYPFPQNRRWTIAFGAVLFALLILSRDTLTTSVCLGFYRAQFVMLAIMGITGLVFLIVNRNQLRQIFTDPRMLLMAAFAGIFLLVMMLKQDWQMMYFSILLCPVFAVFLTYFTDSCRVARVYLMILAVLAVYSILATYGLRRLTWAGIFAPKVRVNSAGMEFYDYLLCYACTDPNWHRNFGIFREPGVYQFFLILGLYVNHYLADWEKPWQLWTISGILTLTMVSTFSVPGMMELVAFVVFLFFDKGYFRTKQGRRITACLMALLAVCVLAVLLLVKTGRIGVGDSILFEFRDIITRLTTDSESLVDRLDAYFTDIRYFTHHPLLGEKLSTVLHGTNHNTTSTLVLFAATGVLGGAVSVGTWIVMLWNRKRNFFGNLILLGILFLSFNTQNLTANLFFWLFPCMSFTQKTLSGRNMQRRKTNGTGAASQSTADPAGNCQGD